MNKVILCGNLGSDPDTKTTGNTTYTRFPVATKNSKGETDWHQIVCFGKTAELCDQYLSKGQKVLLDGEIRYSKYTDNEGLERKNFSIIAHKVEFLTPKSEAAPKASQQSTAQKDRNIIKEQSKADDDFDLDNIPF